MKYFIISIFTTIACTSQREDIPRSLRSKSLTHQISDKVQYYSEYNRSQSIHRLRNSSVESDENFIYRPKDHSFFNKIKSIKTLSKEQFKPVEKDHREFTKISNHIPYINPFEDIDDSESLKNKIVEKLDIFSEENDDVISEKSVRLEDVSDEEISNFRSDFQNRRAVIEEQEMATRHRRQPAISHRFDYFAKRVKSANFIDTDSIDEITSHQKSKHDEMNQLSRQPFLKPLLPHKYHILSILKYLEFHGEKVYLDQALKVMDHLLYNSIFVEESINRINFDFLPNKSRSFLSEKRSFEQRVRINPNDHIYDKLILLIKQSSLYTNYLDIILPGSTGNVMITPTYISEYSRNPLPTIVLEKYDNFINDYRNTHNNKLPGRVKFIIDGIFYHITSQLNDYIEKLRVLKRPSDILSQLRVISTVLVNHSQFPLLFEIFLSARDFCEYILNEKADVSFQTREKTKTYLNKVSNGENVVYMEYPLYEQIQYIIDLYAIILSTLKYPKNPGLKIFSRVSDWFSMVNLKYKSSEYRNDYISNNFCDRSIFEEDVKDYDIHLLGDSRKDYMENAFSTNLIFRRKINFSNRVELLSQSIYSRSILPLFKMDLKIRDNLNTESLNSFDILLTGKSDICTLKRFPNYKNLVKASKALEKRNLNCELFPLTYMIATIDDYLINRINFVNEKIYYKSSFFKGPEVDMPLKMGIQFIIESAIDKYMILNETDDLNMSKLSSTKTKNQQKMINSLSNNLSVTAHLTLFLNYISSLPLDRMTGEWNGSVEIPQDFVILKKHFEKVILPKLSNFLSIIFSIFPTRKSYCAIYTSVINREHVHIVNFSIKTFIVLIAILDLQFLHSHMSNTSPQKRLVDRYSVFEEIKEEGSLEDMSSEYEDVIFHKNTEYIHNLFKQFNSYRFKNINLERWLNIDNSEQWWVYLFPSLKDVFSGQSSVWSDIELCRDVVVSETVIPDGYDTRKDISYYTGKHLVTLVERARNGSL